MISQYYLPFVVKSFVICQFTLKIRFCCVICLTHIGGSSDLENGGWGVGGPIDENQYN